MRKTKLIPEIQQLTPDQLNLVHSWLPGVPFREIMRRMAEQFGVDIKYHKLRRYYHEWSLANQIQATVDQVLHILNGDAIALNPVTEHLIQKAAFTMVLRGSHTPAGLLKIQRLVTYPFEKEMAEARRNLDQERMALEQRKQNTREQELAFEKEREARRLALRVRSDQFHTPVARPEPAPAPQNSSATTASPKKAMSHPSFPEPIQFPVPLHSPGADPSRGFKSADSLFVSH